MITENHQKETLSQAYATAIAGGAGLNFSFDDKFDYGVDGSFQEVALIETPKPDGSVQKRYVASGYKLDFQLKASKNWAIEGDYISYSLEAKTYNDLAFRHAERQESSYALPKILILLCLPDESCDWINVDHSCLTLRDCCYWYAINTSKPTDNTSSIVVKIPRDNILNPENLNKLINRCKVGAI